MAGWVPWLEEEAEAQRREGAHPGSLAREKPAEMEEQGLSLVSHHSLATHSLDVETPAVVCKRVMTLLLGVVKAQRTAVEIT